MQAVRYPAAWLEAAWGSTRSRGRPRASPRRTTVGRRKETAGWDRGVLATTPASARPVRLASSFCKPGLGDMFMFPARRHTASSFAHGPLGREARTSTGCPMRHHDRIANLLTAEVWWTAGRRD
ncbi:unnamed protein product [Hapterophycus canaliculatus]